MTYEVLTHEFIFADERPFDSCHASTLVVLPDGEVLVAWFGGTKEGADDVAIWCSGRVNHSWSIPMKVADQEGIPHWNPVLYRDSGGVIHLYYKIGHKINSWETMVLYSSDDGRTWSEPKVLVGGDCGGRGPVKNKPILLHNGTLAAPASVENGLWDAFVDLSYDGGKSWEASSFVPIANRVAKTDDPSPVSANDFKGKGVIQPTLWESEPGMLHMLLRSTSGQIYRSDSMDSGKTWTAAYTTGLPNNNSGIDLARLDDGMLSLVYNPIGENWGPRTPLVVGLSDDNGRNWEDRIVLEDEPGEYSYPAIVAQGHEIHVTYTWNRERIKYCKMKMNRVTT